MQQEAEWSGRSYLIVQTSMLTSCLLYLLTRTYFTYQLSLMFMTSQQARTITELCPISVIFLPLGNACRLKTEQRKVTQLLPAAHNVFQLNRNLGASLEPIHKRHQGAGIMFTDQANQMLYAFDRFLPLDHTRCIKQQTPTSNNLVASCNAQFCFVPKCFRCDLGWCSGDL